MSFKASGSVGCGFRKSRISPCLKSVGCNGLSINRISVATFDAYSAASAKARPLFSLLIADHATIVHLLAYN